jgi:hypothetical protein
VRLTPIVAPALVSTLFFLDACSSGFIRTRGPAQFPGTTFVPRSVWTELAQTVVARVATLRASMARADKRTIRAASRREV